MERCRPLVVARAGDAQANVGGRTVYAPGGARVDHDRRARVDRGVDNVVPVGDPLAGCHLVAGRRVGVFRRAHRHRLQGDCALERSRIGSRRAASRARASPQPHRRLRARCDSMADAHRGVGRGRHRPILFYPGGNDHWGFQRNAYRIFMQGYWLEGGSRVFYTQPLYRWIAGSLHLVFGDSSVGERYWDGACILAASLLAWRVTKSYAGFRAGLIAMVLTLSVVALGTSWQYVGIGLSEISSAGFLYAAAYVALRGRRGPWTIAAAAGVLATLGFYTRLNNLPMAAGVAAFALPAGMTVRDLARRLPWCHVIAWRSMLTIVATIATGLLLFAWRTWHYTGVFSVLYGTSRSVVAIW